MSVPWRSGDWKVDDSVASHMGNTNGNQFVIIEVRPVATPAHRRVKAVGRLHPLGDL